MLSPHLSQRLGQRQRLLQTPSMRLTMRILAVQASDLRRLISKNVDENPYLDARLPDWKSSTAGGGELDGFAEDALRGQSLSAHVIAQIGQIFRVGDDRYLAMQLAQYLSPYGWLDPESEDAVKSLGFQRRFEDEVPARVLAMLQTMSPAGLFARDLKECLTLQLADRDALDDDCRNVLNHLDAVAEGVEVLSARTGLDESSIKRALKEIRRCNPKPGSAFQYDEGDIFTPDLMMEVGDQGIVVTVNQDSLPTVAIKEGMAVDDEASVLLLTEAKKQVSVLNSAIQNRAEMMLRAGSLLAQQQQDFLIKGEAYIKPMTMSELADQMECHKSTVSRLVADKLVQTPHGIMALSEFFATGLKQPHGQVVAGRAIKARILAMQGAQDLTDAEIAKTLEEEGIVIARRTVNKYRQTRKIT